MPKAIVSNRILLEVQDAVVLKDIKDKLTYRFEEYRTGNAKAIVTVRNYKLVKPGVISIPSGRFDLVPEGYEIEDRRRVIPAKFPEPTMSLRNKQVDVYEAIDDCCFINAKVGWGKTVCALHISRKLGQRTLIIVHTLALLDQWVAEVKKLYGFTPDVISSGECNYGTSIVISNIQSLVKFIPEVSDKFGTVILDEAHHCPASTFTTTLDAFKSRYKIGLSGTTKRKDGRHVLFQDYFSSKMFVPDQEDETLAPSVHVLKPQITLAGGSYVNKVTNLLSDEDYIQYICDIVKAYSAKGYCVLLPGERVEFLKRCSEILGPSYALVTGASKAEHREEQFNKVKLPETQGLIATRSIISEGYSETKLSCVILTSPINNDILLEQLIGRVQRKFEGKKKPIVVDIHFKGAGSEHKQNSNRMAFYLLMGWEIVHISY